MPQYLHLHVLVTSIRLYFTQIRGTLKSWTKLWCVLKPGVLLIYKTHKNGQWVGTVLLNACELIERPSKKDGFCFKLFHPLEQSIWAVKVRTRNSQHMLGEVKKKIPLPYLTGQISSFYSFFYPAVIIHFLNRNWYSSLAALYKCVRLHSENACITISCALFFISAVPLSKRPLHN